MVVQYLLWLYRPIQEWQSKLFSPMSLSCFRSFTPALGVSLQHEWSLVMSSHLLMSMSIAFMSLLQISLKWLCVCSYAPWAAASSPDKRTFRILPSVDCCFPYFIIMLECPLQGTDLCRVHLTLYQTVNLSKSIYNVLVVFSIVLQWRKSYKYKTTHHILYPNDIKPLYFNSRDVWCDIIVVGTKIKSAERVQILVEAVIFTLC